MGWIALAVLVALYALANKIFDKHMTIAICMVFYGPFVVGAVVWYFSH